MTKIEAVLKAAARLMADMSNEEKARLICTLLEQVSAGDELLLWIYHETRERLQRGQWTHWWEQKGERAR
jgi:hypothetical protein